MKETVEIGTGRLRGRVADGIGVFRGIPYAAPPLGAQRFRPAAPPLAWAGVRDAGRSGWDAPQPPSPLTQLEGESPEQNEDCLTLNVWGPDAPGPHPVMVWIHGGGFTTGGANRPLYDGAALARHGGVVVVSLNYRLGILGLLTHPGLTDPATGLCGGWGLLDQIAALEWVRDHIAAFGGDPDAVTVFGESAGGASVALLCSAPRARGLFRRAIVQSASPQPLAFEHAVAASEWLFGELGLGGCDPRALRATGVERLVEATEGWRVPASRGRTAPRPAHGAPLLPYWPEEAVASGLTADVELLVGTNRDEATLFLFGDPRRGTLDAAGLLRRLTRQLEGDAERARRVIGVYEAARRERGEPTDPWALWCAIETDSMIRAPALRLLERHCARGGRGRAYLFTWESPTPGLGATHALELPFCFGTLNDAPGMRGFAGKGPAADRLMQQMRDAWLAFASGRDPGVPSLGPWPAYDAERRTTMIFGAESGAQASPREPERRVWDEVA